MTDDIATAPDQPEKSDPAVSDQEGSDQEGSAAIDTINGLSDQFVARLATLSPIWATDLGFPGSDDKLDDFSPAGLSAMNDLVVEFIAALEGAESTGRLDDVARTVILERLWVERDRYQSGWAHAALNVIDSPLQRVRMIFDMTPSGSAEELRRYAARMRAVPGAMSGFRESLLMGASRGQVVAARQVEKCAQQCAEFAGTVDGDGFFTAAVGRFAADADLAAGLAAAAKIAESAFAEFGHFLTTELRPLAPTKDAVGAARYALASREFLGAVVDPTETYDWGWQEFLAIEAEVREIADRIAPGKGPKEVAALLDADPAYLRRGHDDLQAWMQDLSDRAIADLGTSHFDIPAPLRTLECRIAPPGGGVGAYYTAPNDDFSRPGRMWWSVEKGRSDFTTWSQTTVVYHEGVPGHHLQMATAVLRKDRLNDFQRLLAGTSGHAEGWALYAERLVRELGYLTKDGDLLGMLDSQLFRAARVVVDIGMHLELAIPAGTGFHEGESWTPELGLEFLLTRTLVNAAVCRDEIDRYLGWPGQAPSYKIGERVWLQGRDAARLRHQGMFDEKAFHSAALDLGGMGLEQLAAELARL